MCGIASALTPYHRTIHLSVSPATPCGFNLFWNDYIGNPVTQYRILIDSTNSGNFLPMDSVSFGNTAWTDIHCYKVTDTIAYIVEVDHPGGCTPTLKNPNSMATNLNSSRSNIYKIADTTGAGVNAEQNNFYVNVYPNPSNGSFMLDVKADVLLPIHVDVFDIVGKKINTLEIPVRNTNYVTQQINLKGISAGVYQMKIVSGSHF